MNNKFCFFFVILCVSLLCIEGRVLRKDITEFPLGGLIISVKPTMPYGVWRFNVTTWFHSWSVGFEASCGDSEVRDQGHVYGAEDGEDFNVETIVCAPNETLHLELWNNTMGFFNNVKRSVGIDWSAVYSSNITIFIDEKAPVELEWGSAAVFKKDEVDFFRVRTYNLSGFAYSNTPDLSAEPFFSHTLWYTGATYAPHFTFKKTGRKFVDTFTNPRSSIFSNDFYALMQLDQGMTSFRPGAVPFVQNGTSMQMSLFRPSFAPKIVCAEVGLEPAWLSFSPIPVTLSRGIEEYFPFYINESCQCVLFDKSEFTSSIQWSITYGQVLNFSNAEFTSVCKKGDILPFRVSQKTGSNMPIYATVRSKYGNTSPFGVQYKYRDISISDYWGSRSCIASGEETLYVVEETPVTVDLNQNTTFTIQFAKGQETALLRVINTNNLPTAFEWPLDNLPFLFNSSGYPFAATPVGDDVYSNVLHLRAAFLVSNKNYYFIQINNTNFETYENGSYHFLEGSIQVSFSLNGKNANQSTYHFNEDNAVHFLPDESFFVLAVNVPKGIYCYRVTDDENTSSLKFWGFSTFNSFNKELFEVSDSIFCSRRSDVGEVFVLGFLNNGANYTIHFDPHVSFSFDQEATFDANSSTILVLPPTTYSYIFIEGASLIKNDGMLDGRIKVRSTLNTYNNFLFLEGGQSGNVTVIVRTMDIPNTIQLCSSSDECNGYSCNFEGYCDFPPPTSTSTSSSLERSSTPSTKAPSTSSTARFTSTVPNSRTTSGSITVKTHLSEEEANNGIKLIEQILLGEKFSNETRRFELKSVDYINNKRVESTRVNFTVSEGSPDSITLLLLLQDLISNHPEELNGTVFSGASLQVNSYNYGSEETTVETKIGDKNVLSLGEPVRFAFVLIVVQILMVLL